jgi:hypothetical protein
VIETALLFAVTPMADFGAVEILYLHPQKSRGCAMLTEIYMGGVGISKMPLRTA